MDPALLRKRFTELFPIGYLTLIAIIQAVAFAVLMDSVDRQVLAPAAAEHRIAAAMQAATVLTAIVIITHRYFLLTVTARWRPTILDIVFPYALGVAEVTAALLIGRTTGWWTAVLVLLLTAIASLTHSLAKVTASAFGTGALYLEFRRAARLQRRCCCALAAVSLAVVLGASFGALPAVVNIAVASAVIAAALIVEVIDERDRNRAYEPILREHTPRRRPAVRPTGRPARRVFGPSRIMASFR